MPNNPLPPRLSTLSNEEASDNNKTFAIHESLLSHLLTLSQHFAQRDGPQSMRRISGDMRTALQHDALM